MNKIMQRLRVIFASLLWFIYSAYMSRKWKRAARDVAGAQRSVLKRIIASNLHCEFGREHHFSEIVSIETYQQRVLLRAYEDFELYIERIAQGQPAVLTTEPVQQFGITSGSTQAAKLVPYTKSLVNEFQEGIDPWVYYLFRSFPRIFSGKTYWSVTPIGERKSHTSGGIPIGFDDEQQYFSPLTRWVLGSIMAVPSSLAQLKDMDTFRYVTLRLLLQEKSLAWVSVWNPSFLTLLLDPLAANFAQLIEDMRDGTLSVASEMEVSLRDAILPLCKANPARAAELTSIHKAWQGKAFTEPQKSGRTLYEAIWPRLRVISCWAHGNAAHALPALRACFPRTVIQPKGLLATEAFVSFPFKDDLSALSLLSHFFEFEEVDEAAPAIKLVHELQQGRRYSVIVTTGGGLYRYRLNDVIEVVDFYHRCPLIRFAGRQSKVVDICGEKLNEEYVRATVEDALKKHQLSASFWMMAPQWPHDSRPFYTLFIQFDAHKTIDEGQLQRLAHEIDETMQKSYHYEYARRLGQLASCCLFVIAPGSDASHTYLTVCTDLGQRLGDIKPAALHAYQGWAREFMGKVYGQ
ncbi:MAG TPA: GH3 auxin-responsive promoter family protein [Ktedonobacteraceae bacterium]|nr:GH3 auxin-responsive promoter family protein [Ktedonobacteraceae bacterium]